MLAGLHAVGAGLESFGGIEEGALGRFGFFFVGEVGGGDLAFGEHVAAFLIEVDLEGVGGTGGVPDTGGTFEDDVFGGTVEAGVVAPGVAGAFLVVEIGGLFEGLEVSGFWVEEGLEFGAGGFHVGVAFLEGAGEGFDFGGAELFKLVIGGVGHPEAIAGEAAVALFGGFGEELELAGGQGDQGLDFATAGAHEHVDGFAFEDAVGGGFGGGAEEREGCDDRVAGGGGFFEDAITGGGVEDHVDAGGIDDGAAGVGDGFEVGALLAFDFFHRALVAEVEPEAGGVVEEFATGLEVFAFGLGGFDEADFALIEGDDGVGGVEGERIAAEFGPGFEVDFGFVFAVGEGGGFDLHRF